MSFVRSQISVVSSQIEPHYPADVVKLFGHKGQQGYDDIHLRGPSGADKLFQTCMHAGGKDCALDVTVVNPLQAALVGQAAETPGHALATAHKRKLDKSWQPCHAQGIVFLPLAVESLGAWHKAAIGEIKKLGSSLARHTGEEETTTIRHLFQQLSIALAKGNAALFNNRNPSGVTQSDEGLGW